MNKIKKEGREPGKREAEAKPFKSSKVIKRLKQGSFNGKCYATLIICHLPCKIQIKREKDKILTWGYFIMQNILVLQQHH